MTPLTKDKIYSTDRFSYPALEGELKVIPLEHVRAAVQGLLARLKQGDGSPRTVFIEHGDKWTREYFSGVLEDQD